MSERTESRYGWADASPTHAHAYLMPIVLQSVQRAQAASGRVRLRIVDLGCGNGYVASVLASDGHDVVGVDPAEDGIRIAQARGGPARFISASVYDPELRQRLGGDVDVVVALEVVEHLFRPHALFEAASALLRPGGVLVVSTPYHGYLKNLALSLANGWDRHFDATATGAHIKFFSARTLSRVAEASGFVQDSFRGAGRVPWLWKSMVVEFRRP